MYCKNCGKEVDNNAVICPNCGVQLASFNSNPTQSADKSNSIAVLGFILSFFIPIVGLILSIIGYKKAKDEGYDHKSLALAGIIISAISIATVILVVILVVAVAGAAVSGTLFV